MKTIKAIQKTVNRIYKLYSSSVDSVFGAIFGREKEYYQKNIYASGNYALTSGGAIISFDE